MEKKETSKGFYGGGVGGKLRKSPLRKPQSTPYARPPQTQQIQARRHGGGWLSKLVDPATRIITGGATRILPSFISNALFGDSHFDNHSDAEVNQDDNPEDISNISGSLQGEGSPAEADRPKSGSDDDPCVGNKLGSSSDGSSFSDIEKKLKEITFSRLEYDRLTELLHSKVSDTSHVDERSMKSFSATEKEATDGVLSQENLHEENREASPAPRPQSSLRDQVGASPIDIAKAYMGGRTSESRIGSQSLIPRDERTPLTTDRFSSKFSIPSPLPKPSVCWPGAMVQDQRAYQTPETQKHRIGLHNLPRTPYSRPTHSRSTSKLQGGGDRGISTMPNQWKQSHTPNFGYSQVTRKRSSPDKGFGSLGPIRRTRRNSVEMTPYRGTNFSKFESSDASMDILRIDNQNHVIGPSTNTDKDFQTVNNKPPGGVGITPVHPQSSDVARRILEHLDRTIPTPQKKNNELKMASSWRKPQSSSDPGVLNGLTKEQPHVVEGSDAQKSTVTLQHFSKGKEVANSSPFEAQLVQKKIDVATIDEVKANTSDSNASSSTSSLGFGVNTGVKATAPSVVLRKPDAHRKPPTPHTSGRDKPALSSISITKRDPKRFDNGSGFTFPVPASSSGNISEPPTPSILPFPSASGLPRPQEKTSVPLNQSTPNAVPPSYSFRSKKTEDAIVFSFPFTSSASASGDSPTTPTFKFGSDKKDRLSFRSAGENTICY